MASRDVRRGTWPQEVINDPQLRANASSSTRRCRRQAERRRSVVRFNCNGVAKVREARPKIGEHNDEFSAARI